MTRIGLIGSGFALLALAGCATMSPEAKVRDRLVAAGVGPRMAECLAERLVDKLSYAQLRRLGQVAKLPRQDIGGMRVDELLDRLRALGDPEIVAVTTRATIGCAIAG